jgi:cupin fold WbuC family metalloprotein
MVIYHHLSENTEAAVKHLIDLPESNTPVKLIQKDLFERLLSDAKTNKRLRTNYNFHQSDSDNPHRFLNVMLKGSYFAPHRHLNPPKSESFLVLEGVVGIVIYKDNGEIQDSYTMSSNSDVHGIDIAPGIWHTLHVISGYAVCFEVKPGPYDPSVDKEFADWAPREDAEPVLISEYQSILEKCF